MRNRSNKLFPTAICLHKEGMKFIDIFNVKHKGAMK